MIQATSWPSIDVRSRKLQRLGQFVADEFDLRSDEDNVFVLSQIHTAKQQVIFAFQLKKIKEFESFIMQCPFPSLKLVLDYGLPPFLILQALISS